ncbi:MAG: recombinase family protein [Alteromonadaceae bacterium]|nr:recombinase family protein [Alteromonadaceae bacterium]
MATTILSALYARVSSERQAQAKTIESQIAALEQRITEQGENLLDDYYFIDNGYSGATLARPALERLRDQLVLGIRRQLT